MNLVLSLSHGAHVRSHCKEPTVWFLQLIEMGHEKAVSPRACQTKCYFNGLKKAFSDVGNLCLPLVEACANHVAVQDSAHVGESIILLFKSVPLKGIRRNVILYVVGHHTCQILKERTNDVNNFISPGE